MPKRTVRNIKRVRVRKPKKENEVLRAAYAFLLLSGIAAAMFALVLIAAPAVQQAIIPEKVDDEQHAVGPPGSTHIHATFRVYINDEPLNFGLPTYNERSPFVHLHIDNPIGGQEIHKHATNIRLGDFFHTLGMEFNNNCFTLDTNESYCTNETHTLKFVVNGEPGKDYQNTDIMDRDKYLISYGPRNEDIGDQIRAIPDSVASPQPITIEEQPEA